MKRTVVTAAVAGVIALSASTQTLFAAEEPKWDQKAYIAMGKKAQKQYSQAYKAAMEKAHPPKVLGAKGHAATRATTPVKTQTKAIQGATDIQYDDGTANALPTITSHAWGNRFDTVDGGAIPDSATLSAIQVYMSGVSGNAFLSVFDALNTGAGTAQNINSFSTPMTTGWNTIAASNVGSTARFDNAFAASGQQTLLVGVWYFGGDTGALGTGTTGGQGYHGFHINDSGSTATGYVPLSSVNALIRLTGSNLPVELIELSVE